MQSLSNQRGASLVEYTLLVALLLVVAIAAIAVLGRTTSGQFSTTNAAIDGIEDPNEVSSEPGFDPARGG